MKIALLYPGVILDGFAGAGRKPKTGWIHHGICSISAVLKKAGHEVSLIDLRQLSGWEELPGVIGSIKPAVVGITVMSLDFDAAVKSAKIIKQLDNNIKVVMGGAHPSLMESELIDNENVDYLFKGEAEETLPEVIEDIAAGRIKSKVIQGKSPCLDEIPFIDRSIFNILEIPIAPFLRMPFVTAIAGRGCTYNCSFCQPAEKMIFGKTVRRISPEKFTDELKFTKNKTGLQSLMIHDDCLAEDERWIERFLSLSVKKKINKPFVCQARADIVVKKPQLFRSMKKCGLSMLLIGFESGNQRVLNFLRKGTTVAQNYKAAEICKKLGIRVWANYMLGIPTETNAEVIDTVKMIKKIKPYVPSPAFYTPHPGSDLFDYCEKHHLSLIKKHADYKRNPDAPKIKGVDYDFLNKALEETTKFSRGLRFRRKIEKMKVRRFNKKLIKRYGK